MSDWPCYVGARVNQASTSRVQSADPVDLKSTMTPAEISAGEQVVATAKP